MILVNLNIPPNKFIPWWNRNLKSTKSRLIRVPLPFKVGCITCTNKFCFVLFNNRNTIICINCRYCWIVNIVSIKFRVFTICWSNKMMSFVYFIVIIFCCWVRITIIEICIINFFNIIRKEIFISCISLIKWWTSTYKLIRWEEIIINIKFINIIRVIFVIIKIDIRNITSWLFFHICKI